MRDELAGRLLDRLVDWSDDERSEWVPALRRMASYKYDDYEGFSVGERFFERLARWLSQGRSDEEKRLMLNFVARDLVFISRDELNHAISCVYPDHIKARLIARVADELAVPAHRVREITNSPEFRALRRKTLYLGLSDGARLDRLRRSSPELSHEQFWLSPELSENRSKSVVEKLSKALEEQGLPGDARFQTVVLVDDFYGSGTSLIDRATTGEWKGKLRKIRGHLEEDLVDGDDRVLAEDCEVLVVLYVASAQAEQHIRTMLAGFAPTWELIVIQSLPEELPVTDPGIIDLCEWFFDPVMADEHKGEAPLGYKRAALPVVLHHNTPNNSISLMWADTEDVPAGHRRCALFPRYERHHADRP